LVACLKDRPNSLCIFERLLGALDRVAAVGSLGEIAPNSSRVVASATRIEGVVLIVLVCRKCSPCPVATGSGIS
jgi:hypothetical protein